jgi:hypothetical protein
MKKLLVAVALGAAVLTVSTQSKGMPTKTCPDGTVVQKNQTCPAPAPDPAPVPPPPPPPSTFTVPAGYTIKASTTVCDGITDVTAKLQAEVNALAAYQALQLQAGTCVTSTNINVVGKNHIVIYGAGADATIINALTPDKSALIVTQADTVTIAAMQVVSPNATGRLQIGNSDGFYIFKSSNITVDSVKVGKVAGAGIYFSTINGGLIQNSETNGNLADSFHVTGGSQNITVQFNIARNGGDDAFASIGYANSGQNRNISILDNQAYDGAWAGGIGIEGTIGAKVYRNKIYRSGIAGIRIDAQTSYQTLSSDQIDLQDNYLEGCVTRDPLGHGSIMIYVNYANAAGSSVHGVTGARNIIVNPAHGAGIKAYGYSATNDVIASFTDTQMSGLSVPYAIGAYASVSHTGTTLNGNPV